MAGDAPKARALLLPGSGLTPRLLQTKLSAWPRPDTPSAPSPPQPILAGPLHLPAAAAAAAAAAAPSPARNPHPGEAAALRAPGLRKGLGMERGTGWDGEGAGERKEDAGGCLSVCAPGYVSLLLGVCNCLGGRVDVRPRPCAPCVSECPCAFERLHVLCVHVSVSMECVCVHGRVTLSCVYRQAPGLRALPSTPVPRGCRLQGPGKPRRWPLLRPRFQGR